MRLVKNRSKWVVVLMILFFSIGCTEKSLSNKGNDKIEEKEVKIDLFSMSQCPYTAQIRVVLFMLSEHLHDKMKLNLYFIADEDKDGNITSMHGQVEVDEDIRQLIISKFYPDKFWAYINSRNTDYRSPDWVAHTYIAGIDIVELQRLVDSGGKEMLKENIKKAKELGIQASPTLYIDGKRYEGGRAFPSMLVALNKLLGDKDAIASLPGCFSDGDCISSDSIGVCKDAGSLDAKCEGMEVSLKIVDVQDNLYFADRTYNMVKRLLPSIKTVFIDYQSEEGRELVQKTSANTLPFYLISSSAEKIRDLKWLFSSNSIKIEDKGEDYVVIKDKMDNTRFYLKRERRLKYMELFVMSYCPFGTEAEGLIYPIAKENSIELSVHYIVNNTPLPKTNPEDAQIFKLTSLHGQSELEEDIRQLCVKKYFNKGYFDYVLTRNTNLESSLWERPANEVLGKKAEDTIKKCQYDEGETLIREDMHFAHDLGIETSPTIIWENQRRFNNLEELKLGVELFKDIVITKRGSCGK